MRRRRFATDSGDAELLPFLSLVLSLIPLLLLSVVFVEVAVINVSLASSSMGMPPPGRYEPAPRLQLWITPHGFILKKSGGTYGPATHTMAPSTACRARGSDMTLCHPQRSVDHPSPVDRYDWVGLYNTLLELKREGPLRDHEVIEVVASTDITYDVIIKAMDIARHQRVPHDAASGLRRGVAMPNADALSRSTPLRLETEDDDGHLIIRPLALFPRVVLSQGTRR